jgi:hypothetical protein
MTVSTDTGSPFAFATTPRTMLPRSLIERAC